MSRDEAYAERYDEWSAHMTEDVPFYVDLARQSDGPLVELAVGNGRVAIPVARATGQRVIGIDRSPVMLDQARDAAAAAGVELDLREGDMRDVILDEPAALVSALPVRSCICRPGPTAAAHSSASPRRYGRVADSHGTPSHSITASPRTPTASAGTSPSRTRRTMQSATTGSTS